MRGEKCSFIWEVLNGFFLGAPATKFRAHNDCLRALALRAYSDLEQKDSKVLWTYVATLRSSVIVTPKRSRGHILHPSKIGTGWNKLPIEQRPSPSTSDHYSAVTS